MASINSPALKLAAVVALLSVLVTASHGRLVGGKTEIRDVRTNKEVQELGSFAVEEFNLRQRRKEGGEELVFMEVVEAQQQVVSGIKYYLKISASQNGAKRMFDSVVVVKPWLKSRQLLNFAPSLQ